MLASSTNLLSLIDSTSTSTTEKPSTAASASKSSGSTSAFDAVIAIGCLLKGSTMHFEYICDAVSHGLMRVQLDTGTPVIFGVLTCITEDQALERAGIGRGEKGKGHSEFCTTQLSLVSCGHCNSGTDDQTTAKIGGRRRSSLQHNVASGPRDRYRSM